MFYSHEILTSRQYGVATIWLVATIGSRSSTKKVTRKAIQCVDVQRACEKILEPGAPIALRLQGNLLYGVSRVYSQQCAYMLTDAQKIQGHMMTFLKKFGANELAADAGQARREQLVIEDDPDFIPMGVLPDMRPEMFQLSQKTNKTSSQMSPHNSLLSGSASSSGNERFSVQLDPHNLDLSDAGASPYGLQGLSSAQKMATMEDAENVFGDDIPGAGDFQLEVDEFGNIFEPVIVQDEPDLPPMPSVEDQQQIQQPPVDEQGDFLIMDEQPLPDAEALPARQHRNEIDLPATSEDQAAEAPARKKKKRLINFVDDEVHVPNRVLASWVENYLENCCQPKTRSVTQAQARKNAIHLTFGGGIANVGRDLGIPGIIHPLVKQFSGDTLFTAITGLEIMEKSPGKRPRTASESLEHDEEDRRVRPRLSDDGEQLGRGAGQPSDNDFFDLGDHDVHQNPSEVGREAEAAMSDHPSSAMPWQRHSSLKPASSLRGPGSAKLQSGRNQPSSPLAGRGSMGTITRYSDDVDIGGFDDFALDFGGDNQYSARTPSGSPPTPPDPQTEFQQIRAALDREGQNFLEYMEETIAEHGERRHDEDFDQHRKWIAFDDVFVPAQTNRATAAQAFYHVLGLVTKAQMVVEQESEDDFGAIHVGILEKTGY